MSKNFVAFLVLISALFPLSASATVPVSGSSITNTALASYAASVLGATSNQVSLTVAGSPQPTLTKAFGAASIVNGNATPLVFTITNAAGNPVQIGLGFTDTLPAGLKLSAGATAVISGAGCAGTATLVGTTAITISALSMTVGTVSCTVTVNGVTNVVGQLNAACGALPPAAFTNGSSSISSLASIINSVTNQCLIVGNNPLNGALVASQTVTSSAGATVLYRHTLTNGPLADTYVLSTSVLAGSFTFTNVRILPDANNDGIPDSMTPITLPVSLIPNQVFTFIVAATVPPAAQPTQTDSVQVSAISNIVGHPPIAAVTDVANLPGAVVPVTPDDKVYISKFINATQGTSPSGPYRIDLVYINSQSVISGKTNFIITDELPLGMIYVPNSAVWAVQGGTISLTDSAVGNDAQTVGSNTIMFDLNGQSRYQFLPHAFFANTQSSGTVTAILPTLPPGAGGVISFMVNIAPGFPVDSLINNTAACTYAGIPIGVTCVSNTVTFKVTASDAVTIQGQLIPSANPGDTVVFTNVVTSKVSKTETFNVTLSPGNYPAGTVFKLYKPDGVTPLADTNGDGIPDTGPMLTNATYNVVVKATLPLSAIGGPFKITKTATSITNPLVTSSDEDVVSVVNKLCRVQLVPDHNGTTIHGGSVSYPHNFINLGNCDEVITFDRAATVTANSAPGEASTRLLAGDAFIANSKAGWVASFFLDNPVANGISSPGSFDPTDALVTSATTFILKVGQMVPAIAYVTAPPGAVVGDVDTTVIAARASLTGPLSATDVTRIIADPTSGSPTPLGPVDNIIRGFIDPAFQTPTLYAYIGKDFFLQANASSCNQNANIIETHTIIITGPNGEREELIAVETGPNTGIFQASVIPVRRPAVTPNNRILEGNPYDVFQVEILGCGQKIVTTVTLIDPSGIVFDSRTNQPIAGATVKLVTASGGVCTGIAAAVSQVVQGKIVAAPSSIITGPDGRFEFPLVAPGDYCVTILTPNGYTWASKIPVSLLPPGRIIISTGPTSGGSYGGPFRVGPETGPVILDIPVDSGNINGLFIQKVVLHTAAEVGDFADYTITVSNKSGVAMNLTDILATDNLPAGFAYVLGTARLDGKAIADPKGVGGPTLVFNVGRLAIDQQVKLTYRVRIGPGALQGNGINQIIARYRPPIVGFFGNALFSDSNIATAKVVVTAGVFSDNGYIVGKIFADCNGNGVQDEGELGVPAVRVLLEDGTSAISDAEGKYSFYGISPRTHVLKLDSTTLPVGADLLITSNRNLGKADSRFVDLKFGEIQKADFAINGCVDAVMSQVNSRRSAAAGAQSEADGRLTQRLDADGRERVQGDVKSLPASGTVGQVASVATNNNEQTSFAQVNTDGTSGFKTITPKATDTTAGNASANAPSAIEPDTAPALEIPLEEAIVKLDNKLAFLNLKEGEILPYAQTKVRIKGMLGTTFKLTVNEQEIASKQIGKRATLEDKKLQAWEYFGLNLAAGENKLTVTQLDAFGNARETQSITVKAPGSVGKITLEFPALPGTGAVADGRTAVKVRIKITDKNGVPVTSRTSVRLFTDAGRLAISNPNPAEPGIQVMVENGQFEFMIEPPSNPSRANLRAESGTVKAEAALDFLPELRDMIANGLIEGVLNLRKLDSRAFTPTRTQDAFEQELTHFSRTSEDGKRAYGARAAMFLKGSVKGEYLLTMAYDSERETSARLFRDIQPDQFYPVYGDSSVRTFDAQSTGRFYIRVDDKKSYLLYGDFNTSSISETRKLANYNRSLTGIKEHFENTFISANVFASRDTNRQVIEEFAANGTSGPFILKNTNGLVNSEKIEVLTRDRNQPSIIISAVPLARFSDYEIESLGNRILLKAPVASLDERLNPVSLRVTYEVDQGGKLFWVAGGDVQIKVSDNIELGASYAQDRNPLDTFRLAGINAVAKLSGSTFLIAEIAKTERTTDPIAKHSGVAKRIELKHQDDKIDASVYVGRSEIGFDNQSASLSNGRAELGGKLTYRLDEHDKINAELLRTQDVVAHTVRDGLSVSAEHIFENKLRLEIGLRHAKDSQPAVVAVPGAAPIPDELTSIRMRVTGPIPGLEGASAYGEYEVDPKDSARKIAALGGDYQLANKGRIYLRHEFISSLTGPYGLNTQQQQNATVFGLNSEYMKGGNLFSEYRIRDALSGGDTEAALGLRNTWTVRDGLKLQTGFERLHILKGLGIGEQTALTFGVDYTANALWKGSARLELREASTSNSVLSTIGIASKLNNDWTFLGRNTFTLQKNKGSAVGENEQERFQTGFAYRDTDTDKWNALAMVEHRIQKDTTQIDNQLKSTTELFSIHANWQPRRPITIGTRYAAKWTNEKSNVITSKYHAQLAALRATWDVAERWDLSLQTSMMVGDTINSKQYSAGIELGFMVMENLWLSGGYNFFGFHDKDLVGEDYTNKGSYLRLRYKFDEALFGATASGTRAPASSATNAAQPAAGNSNNAANSIGLGQSLDSKQR